MGYGRKWIGLVALVLLTLPRLGTGIAAPAQDAAPERVTVAGRLIDLTCAVQGQARTGKWNNIAADHLMEDGQIRKGCAETCLLGGQPAALYANGQIAAVLACNPRGSGGRFYLGRYIATPVEVRGYWAAGGPETRVLVPLEIRRRVLGVEARFGSGGWQTIDCSSAPE